MFDVERVSQNSISKFKCLGGACWNNKPGLQRDKPIFHRSEPTIWKVAKTDAVRWGKRILVGECALGNDME